MKPVQKSKKYSKFSKKCLSNPHFAGLNKRHAGATPGQHFTGELLPPSAQPTVVVSYSGGRTAAVGGKAAIFFRLAVVIP